MKRAFGFVISALLAAAFTGCGGGSGSGSNTTVSNLQNRAFVSNYFYGSIDIVDASQDKPTNFTVQVGTNPTFMVPTPSKASILSYADGSTSVSLIDVAKEAPSSVISLPSWSESIAITSDAKTGYAAVKNAPVTGSDNGAIQVLDFANSKISTTIPVKAVRWIALNNAGTKLLAFSDQSDEVRIVDLTATTPTATLVADPNHVFSRPMAAYFTSDDSKAYILSCGAECGATVTPDPANVTELTVATGAMRTVSVNAATVGVLNGTTLYVAGAPGGSGGTIDTIDTTSMTRTASANIGPGSHRIMKFEAGKVWVGATGCGTSEGCLSIYPPGGTPIVDTPPAGSTTKGGVTGMSLVSSRNRMYVVEGGQLRAYDSNTGADITPFSLDIRGAVYDVVAVP